MSKKKLPWKVGDKLFKFAYEGEGRFVNGSTILELRSARGHKYELWWSQKDGNQKVVEQYVSDYLYFQALFSGAKEYWYPDFFEDTDVKRLTGRFFTDHPKFDIPNGTTLELIATWRAILLIFYEYFVFENVDKKAKP